jgi:hypothetical protein
VEPKRGLVITPVEIDGIPVRSDTHVWILASEAGHLTVEYRNQVATLPRDVVVECPVQGPSLEQLRALDECFGRGSDAFEDEHVDAEHYFVIQRCKAHGRRFLRDIRGTIATYERLTLLEAEDHESPGAVWRRYHAMSDDWLVREGRTR